MTFRIKIPNTGEFSSPFEPLGLRAEPSEIVWESASPTEIKEAYSDFANSIQVRVSPRDPDTILIWHPATVPAAFLEQNGLVEVAK